MVARLVGNPSGRRRNTVAGSLLILAGDQANGEHGFKRGFGMEFHILLPSASPLGGRGLTRAVEFALKQSVAVPWKATIKSLRTATSSEKTVIQMLKNP